MGFVHREKGFAARSGAVRELRQCHGQVFRYSETGGPGRMGSRPCARPKRGRWAPEGGTTRGSMAMVTNPSALSAEGCMPIAPRDAICVQPSMNGTAHLSVAPGNVSRQALTPGWGLVCGYPHDSSEAAELGRWSRRVLTLMHDRSLPCASPGQRSCRASTPTRG